MAYFERKTRDSINYNLPNINLAKFEDYPDAMLDWILHCYGFLIARGEKLSPAQFAGKIEKHFDKTTPQNWAAITFLHSIGD